MVGIIEQEVVGIIEQQLWVIGQSMKNKSFQDYAPEKYVTVGKRRFDGVGIKLATKAKATLSVIAKMISNYSGKLFRRAQLIFVTTATTSGGILFRAGILYSMENAKFWPILANYVYFAACLLTFWCTFYKPKQCGGVPKLTNVEM